MYATIHLTVTLDQANYVLTLLGDAPYRLSAPLIGELRSQIIPQVEPPKDHVLEEKVIGRQN